MLTALERVSKYKFLFLIFFVVYPFCASGIILPSFGIHNLFLEDAGVQYPDSYWRSRPSFNSFTCIAIGIHFTWMTVHLRERPKYKNFLENSQAKASISVLSRDYIVRPLPFIILFTCIISIVVMISQSSSIHIDDIRLIQLKYSTLGLLVGNIIMSELTIISFILSKHLRVKPFSAFMSLYLCLVCGALIYSRLIPAVSIFLFLSLISLLYLAIRLTPARWQLLVLAGIAALLVSGSQFITQMTFPGLEQYTASKVSLAESANNNSFGLKPVEALAGWKTSIGVEKPKLVLVATSGGAYRATFWTAHVLDTLISESRPEGRFPGLVRNIRLLTGASGGMIGAAYFSKLELNPRQRTTPPSIIAQLEKDIELGQARGRSVYWTNYPIPRDSLTPVAQQFIQKDILRLFLPIDPAMDRGRVLEESWRTLHTPFSESFEQERRGARPSLILSPVFVETGGPLYISNLDLKELGTGKAGGHEFFKLFPEAHSQFRLSTAVRMNATFPLILPTIALPTTPTRRLGDAGHYDNYGVSAAVAYLRAPSTMAWIKDHTSGVMLIQIRAYRADASVFRQPLSKRNCQDSTPDEEELGTFAWLKGPIEAVMASRTIGTQFRNNLEFQLLQELYGKNFLETVVFENTSNVGMSWYIPQTEMDCIYNELNSEYNKKSLVKLSHWWISRP